MNHASPDKLSFFFFNSVIWWNRDFKTNRNFLKYSLKNKNKKQTQTGEVNIDSLIAMASLNGWNLNEFDHYTNVDQGYLNSNLHIASNHLLDLSTVPQHVRAHDNTAQYILPVILLLLRQGLNVLLQLLLQALKLTHCSDIHTSEINIRVQEKKKYESSIITAF